MTTRKLAATVATLAAVALLATACSSSGGGGGNATTGGTTPSTTDSSSAAAQPVTITFQEQFNDAESAQIEKMLPEFNALHPEITVKLVRDNDTSYYDKLVTQITAGSGPDIARVEPPKAAQYVAAGWTAPLGDAVDAGEYFESTLAGLTKDGELYGVPQDVSTLALFYRTDQLPTAPATWDELKADVAGLTKDGNYGIGLFGGWGAYEFYPWLWQAGAQVLSDDGTTAVFNSPEAVSALQLWVDLQKSGMPDGMATATEDDVKARFISGNLAMFTSGAWAIQSLQDADIDGKWAVAPLPKGEQAASVLGGMDLVVLQNSKNQEAAKTFINWLMQDDVQKEWDSALTYIPVKSALYDDPTFKDDANVAVFAQILQDSKSRPTVAAAGDVDTALGNAVQAALSGTASPQDALDAAVAQANEALSK
jgi:ABC-type glycerol-3-phosphate transport system substrate-binding protein